MLRIDDGLAPKDLLPAVGRMWELSAGKIDAIDASNPPGGGQGAPVFTVEGRYTARGWTEWTQGFQVGSALLQFDATGDRHFYEQGRRHTIGVMAPHVSHIGVHDHGFNNISTYGTLRRLIGEGRVDDRDLLMSELALKVSGAVQAARWSRTADGGGYIYSFNGPQSLFVDTIRSCRSLAVAHQLGHVLMGEHDERIDLLERLTRHAESTAKYNVYFGEGRDVYDLRGRTVHEALFNVNDGRFRAPSTQQGYSPFSTWTRGLAWAMLGFAELLEFHESDLFRAAAQATCDFYIEHSPADGIPYWDTGAPGLVNLDVDAPADPYNAFEPVDSSAAAIAAQGLLRLGRVTGEDRYTQAGLTVTRTLLQEPYLSTDPRHEGLLLHSVYHRPNGWDHVAAGQSVPNGESSMWGDYHLRELALYVGRLVDGPYYTFFGGAGVSAALVTGASRGIGRGIALALAGAGFDVVVNYASNLAAAEDTAGEIEKLGVRAALIRADVGDAEDRARLVHESHEAFGGLDLLVNNAGVAPAVRADLLEATEESFDRLVGINLKGPYFLTQQVARRMIEAGTAGKIVTISSMSAYTASVNRGDYCVTKAGLGMMTKLFAARLAEHGITVFEVRPGIIATDMTGPVKEKYDKLILTDGLTPIRRWGTPEDVGRAVVAIATDLLPFSTGQVIDVDGGFHLRTL